MGEVLDDLPFGGYLLEDREIGGGWFVSAAEDPRFGGGWLAFREPVETRWADTADELVALLKHVAQETERGRYATGFVSFDGAPAFDHAFVAHRNASVPLAGFHIYDKPPVFYKELLSTRPQTEIRWMPEVGRDWFLDRCARIKHHLEVGDTYQVNLSFRLNAVTGASLPSVFTRLVGDEPPPYASLFLSDRIQVASLSPELFFEMQNGRIRCRPMKGTAPLGPGNADRLRNSEKDRAENLMIVDMIRNDLGRIAETGSVRTTSLFDVEPYSTVLQMTSTVEASFGGSVPELFGALFPCASIVGAPKVKTMEIIRDLEMSPRGVYSGAIGFACPSKEARFAVAIRTITEAGGKWEYGAGSGIVWDSDPEAEWQETLLKTAVLKTSSQDWGLFETFNRAGGLLERHLDRMEQSAMELGIRLDRVRARELVESMEEKPLRVKLTLFADGRLSIDAAEFSVPEKLEAKLARRSVCSADPSLRHKTNRRRIYERALRESGVEEALLWNERGEATEFCRGNLVADINGRLITPPFESGLLPGVLRAVLLERGEIEEGLILVSDLDQASAIHRINSLTGWVPIELKKDVD